MLDGMHLLQCLSTIHLLGQAQALPHQGCRCLGSADAVASHGAMGEHVGGYPIMKRLMVSLLLACVHAGLLLGAKAAVATDIHSLAVRAAEANAALNNVQQQMHVLLCGAALDHPDPLLQVGGDM